MNTCLTCKHWTRRDDSVIGDCNCSKFVYTGQTGTLIEEAKTIGKDGLGYYDLESYSAGFRVGENFGCIHHKNK